LELSWSLFGPHVPATRWQFPIRPASSASLHLVERRVVKPEED
jgi:hypothetical protein